MSQLPGAQAPLRSDVLADADVPRDSDVTDELLPSAADNSGLSPAMRERLDAQVQSAGGNVEQIVQDLRSRIAEIDSRPVAEGESLPQQLQAERALIVSQVSYLEDHVAGHRIGSSSDMAHEVGSSYDTGGTTTRTMGTSRRHRVRVYNTTAS